MAGIVIEMLLAFDPVDVDSFSVRMLPSMPLYPGTQHIYIYAEMSKRSIEPSKAL